MKQMVKINETVGMKNSFTMDGGGKQKFSPFRRQEFWKCIGYILSTVTYGNKGHKIWSETPKSFGRTAPNKLKRDVRGNTDLYRVCCYHYRHFYTYACH